MTAISARSSKNGLISWTRPVLPSDPQAGFDRISHSVKSFAGWEGVGLQLDQVGPSMSMGWRWTSLPSHERQLLCAALDSLLRTLAFDGAAVSEHRTPYTLMLAISSQSLRLGLKDFLDNLRR